MKYIVESEPVKTALCVERTGWCKHAFILPGRCIGELDELCIYQPKGITQEIGTGCKGTLAEWQKLAKLCAGNSRLVFCISSAFAAPILSLIDMESGGFNLFGDSSIGKSTALLIACSVNGSPNYRNQWRSTDNGIESLCVAHNDLLLVLDEAGGMEPKVLGKVCYLISNEQEKSRANSSTRKTWKILSLSSAEPAISQYLSEDGQTVRGGQTVRLIDIPADAGKGYGIFEDLKDVPKPGDFAEILKELARQDYGHPLNEYLIKLGKEVETNKVDLNKKISRYIAQFKESHVPQDSNGQVIRCATRFALVAYAGELATEYGITDWNKGESEQAAKVCFNAWLDHRGGIGSQEWLAIRKQVQYFFQKHFDRGFVDIKDGYSNPPDRKGFRADTGDGIEFWVFPTIFTEEVCTGYNPDTVKKCCINAGYLIPPL